MSDESRVPSRGVEMSRRALIAVDLLLIVAWLTLAAVSGLNDWGWGWTAFFGFAAGERNHSAAKR